LYFAGLHGGYTSYYGDPEMRNEEFATLVLAALQQDLNENPKYVENPYWQVRTAEGLYQIRGVEFERGVLTIYLGKKINENADTKL
jgi:hypothetical protein